MFVGQRYFCWVVGSPFSVWTAVWDCLRGLFAVSFGSMVVAGCLLCRFHDRIEISWKSHKAVWAPVDWMAMNNMPGTWPCWRYTMVTVYSVCWMLHRTLHPNLDAYRIMPTPAGTRSSALMGQDLIVSDWTFQNRPDWSILPLLLVPHEMQECPDPSQICGQQRGSHPWAATQLMVDLIIVTSSWNLLVQQGDTQWPSHRSSGSASDQ